MVDGRAGDGYLFVDLDVQPEGVLALLVPHLAGVGPGVLAAEAVHGQGVVAVHVASLEMGGKSVQEETSGCKQTTYSVCNAEK